MGSNLRTHLSVTDSKRDRNQDLSSLGGTTSSIDSSGEVSQGTLEFSASQETRLNGQVRCSKTQRMS